jgi:peptidoglycan-associated lipoprotein
MKLMPLAALVLAAGLAACSSGSTGDGSADGRGTAPPLGQGIDAGRGGVGQSPLGGTARPGSQEDLASTVGDRVLFATDAFRVGGDQAPIVQRQAEWMNRYPQVQVTVEGHADERGTREYNLALGQRRANSVRDLLVSNGVASARVQTISFGKDRPVQLGSSEEAWAQNRRAVTMVR